MIYFFASAYQKNSLGWQFRKLTQRIEEWIFLQWGKWQPDLPEALDNFSFPSRLLEILFWLTVSALISFCLWQLYRLWMSYWSTLKWSTTTANGALSTTPHRSVSDWLKVAREFQQQQNYPEACRALYMAMIERLQETQLVPKDTSITDGEYDRLIAKLPQSANCRTLLQTHTQMKFGQKNISQERYQDCQNAYQSIEQDLGQ